MDIDKQHIEVLIELVRNQIGEELSGYSEMVLSRQICQRQRELSLDTGSYIALCERDIGECKTLFRSVSINVSSFFRNPIVFEIIAQSILPRLISPNRELRVWSAGCASGEEAYSIAILIHQMRQGAQKTKREALIFATDIDENILKKARAACYPRSSLKETRHHMVDTYFSMTANDFSLHPEVKKMVHFSRDDLLSQKTAAPADSIFGAFDLILCRNVLIYFSEQHREQVQWKLHASLTTGGYLVLGDSESLCKKLKQKYTAVDARNNIFQKNDHF